MELPNRITATQEIMMGKPCVRGTRIPVYLVLQKMEGGESEAELLSAYPQLVAEDLRACIEYGAGLTAEEVALPLRRGIAALNRVGSR